MTLGISQDDLQLVISTIPQHSLQQIDRTLIFLRRDQAVRLLGDLLDGDATRVRGCFVAGELKQVRDFGGLDVSPSAF